MQVLCAGETVISVSLGVARGLWLEGQRLL
jgi:hypothetical protein